MNELGMPFRNIVTDETVCPFLGGKVGILSFV